MPPFLFTLLSIAPAVADSTKNLSFRERLTDASQMSLQQFLDAFMKGFLEISLRVIIAGVVFYIGRWLIKRVRHLAVAILTRRNIDLSLRTFLMSLMNITLTIFLLVIVINIMGIGTTSFVALFASAGVAIGMALSGTLQNFAGGVMILLFKPYQVGDFIEAQGQTGTVKEIQIFSTLLTTPDNKVIIVPNGGLATGIINNYSKENQRRVDWKFGIAYGDSYDSAKKIIIRLLEQDNRIHKDPVPFIALNNLGDSSVTLVVRAWVNSDDYWNVFFDMNEMVYKTFGEEGINFPFPQMDVHLIPTKAENS